MRRAPLPAALLPFTSDLLSVIDPWLTMPAPLVCWATLLSISLLLMTALLPLAMPPAAMGGPLPVGPGRAVAVLPSTWLLFRTSWPVPGGVPPLPLPLEIPAPLGAVLPSTSLLLRVSEPSRFWMPPPPPAFGAVLSSTWLLLKVRQAGGAGEVQVVAVGDATTGKALGRVAVHLAPVQRQGAEQVDNAAAADATDPLGSYGQVRSGCCRSPGTVIKGQLGDAARVKGGAGDAAAGHQRPCCAVT